MITIGVTGTKGKTTTTYMIRAILEAAGRKVGLIGTAGAIIGSKFVTLLNETGDPDKALDGLFECLEK